MLGASGAAAGAGGSGLARVEELIALSNSGRLPGEPPGASHIVDGLRTFSSDRPVAVLARAELGDERSCGGVDTRIDDLPPLADVVPSERTEKPPRPALAPGQPIGGFGSTPVQEVVPRLLYPAHSQPQHHLLLMLLDCELGRVGEKVEGSLDVLRERDQESGHGRRRRRNLQPEWRGGHFFSSPPSATTRRLDVRRQVQRLLFGAYQSAFLEPKRHLDLYEAALVDPEVEEAVERSTGPLSFLLKSGMVAVVIALSAHLQDLPRPPPPHLDQVRADLRAPAGRGGRK